MLRNHSSEIIEQATGLHNAPSGKEARVVLLGNRGIAHENRARAAQPALDKVGVTPRSTNSERSGSPEYGAWSPVFTFLMETFALCGASLHPAATFPVDAFLADEKARRPSSTSSGFAAAGEDDANLLSEDDGPVEFERIAAPDAGRSGHWNWLASSRQAFVTLWMHWRRERKVKEAVVALMELDDRTLRDMGIPDRSQIEQAVRCGRDC